MNINTIYSLILSPGEVFAQFVPLVLRRKLLGVDGQPIYIYIYNSYMYTVYT